MWARTIPSVASAHRPYENPSARTPSRPATSPPNSVIGSTAARVTTSQRVTPSSDAIGRSGGGLVVRSA